MNIFYILFIKFTIVRMSILLDILSKIIDYDSINAIKIANTAFIEYI